MKTLNPKTLIALWVIALLLVSNGCVTQSTIKYAEGHPDQATLCQQSPPEHPEPQPGYYALLPVAVPIDIVLSPAYVVAGIGAGIWFISGGFHE
jgi:hypothetical protein